MNLFGKEGPMRIALILLGGVALALAGCGSGGAAPVSGKVTLNGKPLAKATVTFQPTAKGGMDAGVASTGETNDQGEYTLKVVGTGAPGAIVGEHRVSITALQGPAPDPKDDNPKPREDLVPERYNAKTELKFTVPSGGTKEADFKLTSHTGGS